MGVNVKKYWKNWKTLKKMPQRLVCIKGKWMKFKWLIPHTKISQNHNLKAFPLLWITICNMLFEKLHGSTYSESTLWMSGSCLYLLRGMEEFQEVVMRPKWCCEPSWETSTYRNKCTIQVIKNIFPNLGTDFSYIGQIKINLSTLWIFKI